MGYLQWVVSAERSAREWLFSLLFPLLSAHVLQPLHHPFKTDLFGALKSLQQPSDPLGGEQPDLIAGGLPDQTPARDSRSAGLDADNGPAKKPHRLKILEIGVGGGFNLQYYPAGSELIAVEPNPHWALEKDKLKKFSRIQCIQGYAEDMRSIASGSIDAVVSTYCLCYVPHRKVALKEISRVLRKGGKFLYFDHVTFDPDLAPFQAWLQRWLQPVWTYLGCGCHFKGPTHVTIEESKTDLQVEWFKSRYNVMRGVWRLLLFPAIPHEYGVAVKQ